MDPVKPNPLKDLKTKILQKVDPILTNHITTISVAGFVLLSLIVVIFLYYQNQKLKSMLAKYQSPSPTPVATRDPMPNWKVITNTSDFYTYRVPKEWDQLQPNPKLPHQTIFKSADGLYRFTADAVDNLNSKTGKPYLGLDDFVGLPYTVKSVVVGGQDARQPLPRAGSESLFKVYFLSHDSKLIFSLELLVGDGSGTDHRVTPEIIDIASKIFDQSLSTFEFTEGAPLLPNLPPSPTGSPLGAPKACTTEAKLCPDGSFVARTGPNCEFSPCPTPKH